MAKVHCKKEMYRLMKEGEFGNYNLHWDSVHSWALVQMFGTKAPLWGLRSMGAGKNLRLDVPTMEVAKTVEKEFPNGCQISPMVDQWLTFRGEVMNDPANGGLVLRGGSGLRDVKWREFFRDHAVNIKGLSAYQMLRKFLYLGDYEDLMDLMDRYPDHVVEFTSCNRYVGAIPRRNTIIWEVRPTDGSYENWSVR